MFLIINYFESPGGRIRGYPKTCKGCISLPHPAQKNAKLFGLSWFNLSSVVKQDSSECWVKEIIYPPNGISSPKRFDFPLITVSCVSHKSPNRTYQPGSLRKKCGWSTTYVSRVLMDVHEGLGVQVLDFVDPRFQISIFEDGSGTTGRVRGHGYVGCWMLKEKRMCAITSWLH